MISFDKKILWKYIYSEYLNPKKFIKQISFYRYLVLIFLAYVIIFAKLSPKFKVLFFILAGIIMIYLDIKSIELSGEHRFWHKKKTGIPTRSDIRAMKYAKKKDDNAKKNSAQEILDEVKQEITLQHNTSAEQQPS